MADAKLVSVKWKGETYEGHYRVEGDVVVVTTSTAEVSERGGDLTPVMTARRLLFLLARKARAQVTQD